MVLSTPPPTSALPAPQQFRAKLENKEQYNDRFIKFSFELVEPHTINFLAGQYISIKATAAGVRRSYSISSTPDFTNQVETLVDIAPGGIGTQFLQSLAFGDEVEFLAPLGRLVVPQDLEVDQLVFIATGSGISPFKSMIEDQLRNQHDQRPITLHWGMRSAQDLFWMDDWHELMEAFPNFNFHPVLSQAPEEWTLCRGRVTNCLMGHGLPANAAYFVCGNQAMIEDVTTLLVEENNENKNLIFQEKFF